MTTKKKTKKTKKFKVTVKDEATTAAPATTQASADATTALPADVKVESLLLDKSSAEVVEGSTVTLTATKTPAAAQATVTWTSSDTKVATVKDGVVTGIAAGTATITAEADGKKAEAKITVTKKEVVATLLDAKQKSANQVSVLFDTASANAIVNKTDIKITNVSSNAVAGIDTLTFENDGKTAVAKLTAPLVDQALYEVSYKDAKFTFTASVGAVASITIDTDTAELNTATPVKFRLLDATGMDVTSTVAIDARVTLSETGAQSHNFDKASAATITLGNVGDKCEVTVTYDKGDGKSDLINGVKTITCVPAGAKVGTPVFYQDPTTKQINENSGAAMFYNGLKSDNVKVAELGGTAEVHFYADASGEAISYDSYEVEPVDADVLSCGTSVADGKYCIFSVTGSTAGTSYVKVKATKNSATTEYTVPVTVTKVGELSSIQITGDKEGSNAEDDQYVLKAKATAAATGGSLPAGVTYKWEVTSDKLKYNKYFGGNSEGIDTAAEASSVFITDGSDSAEVSFNLAGLDSDSITLKCTATDPNTAKSVARTWNVGVKKVQDSFWVKGDGAAITYALEASTTSYKLSSVGAALPTFRVKALSKNVFAGYVAPNGDIGDHNMTVRVVENVGSGAKSAVNFSDGYKYKTADSEDTYTEEEFNALDSATVVYKNTVSDQNKAINFGASEFKASVTRGSNEYKIVAGTNPGDASQCNVGKYDTEGTSADATTNVTINPYANVSAIVINTIAPAKSNVATTATTITFTYKLGGKTYPLTTTVNFTNDFKVPTVKPISKTYDVDPEEAYSTNVDLNNNGSSHASITGVFSDAQGTPFEPGKVATHVNVTTNINSATNNVTFFISSNAGKLSN